MPQAGEAAAAVVAGEADAGAAVVPALTLTPATLSSYEHEASLVRLASRDYRAVFAVRDAARGTGFPVT